MKIKRVYIFCFNVSPEFATAFKFPKVRSSGDWQINYLEASFNKDAECGEFFIEFDDQVYEDRLVECFEAQGAGEVCTVTFKHNDGEESAVNALLRVVGHEGRPRVTRGTCPESLQKALRKKQQEEAERKKYYTQQEYDEKSKIAEKRSLDEMKESLQSQTVKLEKIESDVQLQAADVVDIKNGVCGVIPDYQKKITNLEEALAHKTKLCDRIEGQKGRLTMEINKLKWEVTELNDKTTSLQLQNSQQNKKIQELQEQLDICKSIALLKQTHEELQRTAEILASTLEEERAAKRARA